MSFFILLLLTGCVRQAPPVAAGESETFEVSMSVIVDDEHPIGRHPGADICFPTAMAEGWEFMGTNSYDNPAGLDISWSYRSDDATLLTVYAYPHHEPHPEFTDLDWATAEVRTSASQVTDVEWGDTMMMETGAYSSPSVFAGGLKRLPLGPMIPPDMHAEVAAELGLESLDGVTRAFPVLVLVQSFDGWFLKLRATWMDEQVPAQRMVQQLSGWSGMPCAYFEGQGLPMVDMDGE